MGHLGLLLLLKSEETSQLDDSAGWEELIAAQCRSRYGVPVGLLYA
jgi:hypothetical protein